jgi:hypothetical protein
MPLIKEIDYGTPASISETQVTLTIDGREVSVPEGTSIMRAATHLGVAARPVSTQQAATPRFTTALASPNIARARRRQSRHGDR